MRERGLVVVDQGRKVIDNHLAEFDREWDVQRVLEANAGVIFAMQT
jgi:hypothetical protein